MSFRGGRGGSRGGGRGGGGGGRGFGGGRGGRGGGGGGGRFFDQGPPQEVIEVGYFAHCCENDLVCMTTCGKIPYFNAPVYFENKEQIGKIDEIFGGLKDNGFSVKLGEGLKSSSFKSDQKIFIDPGKLLPVERFLNGGPRGGGRGRGGGQRGGGRGGRGGPPGRGGGPGRFQHGGRGGGGRGGGGFTHRGRGGGYGDRGGFKRSFEGGDRNQGRGGNSGGGFAKKTKFN